MSAQAANDSGDQSENTNTQENPNDLATEMTDSELESFVQDTLGIESTKEEDSEDEADTSTDSTEDTATDDETDESGTDDDAGGDEEEAETDTPQDTPDDATTDTDEEDTTSEVQTDDLWLEVDKLVEKDGKQTTEKVKLVFDPNNPEAFIPDDFKFTSDKQLFDILESKRQMAELYEKRESELSEKQTKNNEAKERKEQLAAWDAEVEELIEDGFLEKPKVKPGDDNWKDDPSVKEIDETFKYMTELNQKRIADGKQPIRSFTHIYHKRAKEVAAQKEAEEKKQKTADAKKKGALVGGSSSTGSGTAKGYTPGQYGSIWEVPIEDEQYCVFVKVVLH